MLEAMRIAAVVGLSIFLVLLLVQSYSFFERGKDLEGEYEKFEAQLRGLEEDTQELHADYEYYVNPENLEKELRARFNYRSPDEKLIIIIPNRSSSSATSS